MACARACVSDNRKLTVRNLEGSHVEGSLQLQWHCNMPQKICLSLLSGLMYITSLSVDDCEHNVANRYSFSHGSIQTGLCIIKLRNLTTSNAQYGLPTLLYGYKTGLSV